MPKARSGNGHLEKCFKFSRERRGRRSSIDRSAMCGADIELDKEASIEANVAIGFGCVIGSRFTVGKGAQLGNFIEAGKRVVIGRGACVDSHVYLPDKAKVEDYAAAKYVSESVYLPVEPSEGMKFVLRDGRCEEVDKVTRKSSDTTSRSSSLSSQSGISSKSGRLVSHEAQF